MRPIRVKLGKVFADVSWALKKAWAISPALSAYFFIASFMRGILPVFQVIATRFLIDEVVQVIGKPGASLSGAVGWLAALFALALLDLCAMLIGTRYLLKRLEDELNTHIAAEVMRHANRLPLHLFEDLSFQDSLERAQQNIALNYTIFLRSLVEASTGMIELVLLFAVLLFIEPMMIWIALVALPPYSIIMAMVSRRRYQNEFQRAPERRWTRYFTEITLNRDYATEMRFLGIGDLLVERFRRMMQSFADENAHIEYRALLAGLVFALISLSLFFLLFYRVLERVTLGLLSLGDVAILGGAIARVSSTAEVVVARLGLALERSLHVANLRTYLAIAPEDQAEQTDIVIDGQLEFRNVSFTYPGTEKAVLKDVSFTLKPGETLAIVGENGAGKSTLIKLIARIYEPSSGSIWLGAHNLTDIAPATIYRHVAFVLQNFGRYEATAADNIAYGQAEDYLHDREAVEALAKKLDIHAMIAAMPQGYDTFLGRRFGKYDPSGGQWQQIAIARSFARDARLLILDEPTASLDARTEAQVFAGFIRLSQGRSTLLISHRFTTVSLADRILVLDDGRIVEQGSHDELLKNGQGFYAQLYRLHLDKHL